MRPKAHFKKNSQSMAIKISYRAYVAYVPYDILFDL